MKNFECHIEPIVLDFKRPSGTSRGILTQKFSWLIHLKEKGNNAVGVGECSIIKTLSPDWNDDYVKNLHELSQNQELLNNPNDEWFKDKPSIKFGLEMAHLDLKKGGEKLFFDSKFTAGLAGIPINGLIWMGDKQFMFDQIQEKLEQGFDCIKLKIGAIDFQSELDLLAHIRSHFSADKIELRVDANGAFSPVEALNKLNQLHQFELHSIEQPIKQNQWEAMADLCQKTPFPIALDEELIGVPRENRAALLDTIKPQYIILKPSLVGGFSESEHWISLCESRNIGWWMTSALESNIGLNALAQWTFTLNNPMPQGLGTGGLYTNNFDCPLYIENGFLRYSVD